MDCVVTNGTIVTSSGVFKADVGIADGRIVQIGGTMVAKRTLDAAGRLVMPGGIDVHTHLDAPSLDMMTVDDFQSGTIAAACGGTTSLIDFCQQSKGGTLAQGIALWDSKARGKAAIDYGYHMIVVDLNEAVIAELATLPERGITSFKLFMAYRGGSMVDDLSIILAMEQARRHGALTMVHAENGDGIFHLQGKMLAEGKTSPHYHAVSRPARLEAEATARAIALAEMVGAPLYVVHVSCAESLEEVVRGKLRGAPIIAETCAHYLFLTAADLDRPNFEGAKFVCSPPIREAKDQTALWNALRNDLLETVSSDHSTTSFLTQKQGGRDDFTKIPNGIPGIEERMTLLFQGVVNGMLSLEQFVDLNASRPARVFGLDGVKGSIAVGADADIVVWDPDVRRVLRQSELHHAVDYTSYEGLSVRGGPRMVMSKGRVIVDEGQYVGTPGDGKFLHRKRHIADKALV